MSAADVRPDGLDREDAEERAETAVRLLVDRYGAEYAERWLLHCLGVVRRLKAEEVRRS